MKFNLKTVLFSSMVVAIGLSHTACTPAPKPKPVVVKPVMTDAQKHAVYRSTMRKVGTDIKQDFSYQKLDLSTPELKNWFTDITYKLWDHQISKNQFIAYGLRKFPAHQYEFNVIANGLLAK